MTLMLSFPLEDASGDGELDLSGIDDLEIDRVSDCLLCAPLSGLARVCGLLAQAPVRGPQACTGPLQPWGMDGLCWPTPVAPGSV